MASKIQKHAERVKRISTRMEKLERIRDTKLEFAVKCTDGYTRVIASVLSDGKIQLRNFSVNRSNSRDLATWLLEMHAGHVDPPEPPKEDKPS